VWRLSEVGVIGDRWGVSDDELERHYPCDDYVPSPVMQAWRGVTVDAPAARVWPWVAQIRLAPYSYDWIDNLGHRSPRALKNLPAPRAGEAFTTALGRPLGRILDVDEGVALTGTIGHTTISYVLIEQSNRTRLLMKIVASRGRLTAPFLCVGDVVMARRQLLNLRSLAESASC
jgi:hypothetical protein